jgi:hypothetical protein
MSCLLHGNPLRYTSPYRSANVAFGENRAVAFRELRLLHMLFATLYRNFNYLTVAMKNVGDDSTV